MRSPNQIKSKQRIKKKSKEISLSLPAHTVSHFSHHTFLSSLTFFSLHFSHLTFLHHIFQIVVAFSGFTYELVVHVEPFAFTFSASICKCFFFFFFRKIAVPFGACGAASILLLFKLARF